MKVFRNTHRFYSIFLSSLLYVITVCGQAINDPKEDFLYGEFYLEQYKHQEALTFYLSALKYSPDNCNLNYRVGLCYMNIIGQQTKALPFLEKSVLEINENYVPGKYKNNGAPKEAWLLLGDAYHRDNKLLEASFAYNKYKELIQHSEKEKNIIIHDRIVALGISNEQQRDKHNIRFINLGQNINSRFSDYNPVLSGNQEVLLYTQYWESYDRIMMSRKTPDGWTVPIEINEQIGSFGNCYTSSISYDGTELYLIKNNDNNFDIYVAVMQDSLWGEMQALSNINTRYHESSACISSDGYYLYFSSNRPGGEGGFDIYQANKVDDKWGNQVNIGSIINTKGDEEAPFITMDGTILYFSSDGHESVGNMDILYSEKKETGGWKEPVNIGVPMNTTDDDLFFVFYKESRSGYLSRDRAEGYGKNDIYKVHFGEVPALELNESTQFEEVASMDLTSDDRNKINTISHTAVSSEFISDTTHLFHAQDTSHTYTIQIMALKNPMSTKKFSISPLLVSHGNDGFFRYSFGEYLIYSEALLILYDIRESGFPDAFIREVTTIQNYSGDLN